MGWVNRIPDARRDDLIEFALEHEALTTRELAVKYTDEKRYFISESSAYRMLKAADLITAPDYVVIKAADEFVPPLPRWMSFMLTWNGQSECVERASPKAKHRFGVYPLPGSALRGNVTRRGDDHPRLTECPE